MGEAGETSPPAPSAAHGLRPGAPPAAAADTPAAQQIARAWELSYLDPLAARELGREVAEAGGPLAADGWLHVALAEVRVGDEQRALHAMSHAHAGFSAEPRNERGLALCGEVQAIALRRRGDFAATTRLLDQLDHQSSAERDPMHGFIAHNSRAISAKLLGQTDTALHHLYAASDAANRTGWVGPRITALANLGSYQQDLFNLEDARRISEQVLGEARAVGARQIVGTAAANLVIAYHAIGDMQQARAMAEFLLTHPDELLPGALSRYKLPLALGHLAVGEIDEALRYLSGAALTPVGSGDGVSFQTWLMARCLLARGDAAGARATAEAVLAQRRQQRLDDPPYDLMALHRVLADACEQAGDAPSALAYLREAQARYEELVGRSARARYIALEVNHQLAQAQRERDQAVHSQRSVEDDHRRLAELNGALQAQIQQTEMLHAKLREQALRDPLTGLHNRRYLFEMAPGLLELARRQTKQLCVVLMDLDHFKLLNDTYGHAAGDLVLQRFSALLTQMLRRSDVVVRYGGEEFVAVMPDIEAEGAQVMLGRLLEAFQAVQVELGRRRLPRGSFSAGIALFPRHGNTLEQLLQRADRGLYAAKNQGRARIELAPRTGFGTLG